MFLLHPSNSYVKVSPLNVIFLEVGPLRDNWVLDEVMRVRLHDGISVFLEIRRDQSWFSLYQVKTQ
jgi:hypothetical protein